jgi:hypothetical protein
MNLRLHFEISGVLLLTLGLAHCFFARYFGWKEELARLSVFTRQVFLVHCFFIALAVALLGACSLFYADALLEPSPLSRVVLAGVLVFWLCRLGAQWFGYSPAIWRGKRFYTAMHFVFSGFWIYLVLIYAAALQQSFHPLRAIVEYP